MGNNGSISCLQNIFVHRLLIHSSLYRVNLIDWDSLDEPKIDEADLMI